MLALELVGFFIVAFLIRIVGSHWGLANALHNQTFHPDEEVNWRYAQFIDPARFHFTPGFYNYGTLYLTLLRIASDMTSAYTGRMHGNADWAFISRAIYAGRILSILSGCWLVLIGWFSGLRIGNKWTGRATATVLMVSPGLVVHSRFATVDILAAALAAASGYYALKLVTITEPERNFAIRWAIYGGIFAGLSAGTKYSGILAVLMIGTALFVSERRQFVKGSVLAVVSSLVVFILVTPGVILDSHKFVSDLAFEVSHEESGHGLVFVGTSPAFIYQLGNLVVGMGLLIVTIGLIYLFLSGWKRKKWAWVLLAFFLPTYFLIGKSQVKFYRYSIPLSFPIALSFAMYSTDLFANQRYKRLAIPIVAISLVGLDGGALISTIRFTSWMIGPDPRDEAAGYIKSISTSRTTVGVVEDPWFWTPPIYPNTGLVRMVPFEIRNQFRILAKDPSVVQYIPSNPNHRIAWDDRLINDDHPDFVTYSDFESLSLQRISNEMKDGAHFDPGIEKQVRAYRTFMSALTKNYVLDATYGPHLKIVEDLRYVAPTVYLWKRK